MTAAVTVLAQAVKALQSAGLEQAAGDARILLGVALGVERAQLIAAMDDPLSSDAEARFTQMVAARSRRQPVSQIIGWRDFWSRRFAVTSDVLDPRPDSETLIAAALEQGFSRLLDLGTGSGALAVTLLAERPDARGLAVDISAAALRIAARNAATHGVADRLELRQSDWLAAVDRQFDLIICNPPYICRADWAQLSPDVRLYEPEIALTPGEDGLAVYRALAGQLPAHLEPNARVLFEIGFDQGQAVAEIMRQAGWSNPRVLQDINGHDRVVCLQKSK